MAGLDDWVAVFAENDSFPADKRLETLIRPHHVVCGQENIAGVTVPVFQELSFEEIQYDVADYPLWVDTAAVRLREIARLDALEKTLRRQVELLEQELRSTAQRVKRSRSPRPRRTSGSSASTWATSRPPPWCGARSPRRSCRR